MNNQNPAIRNHTIDTMKAIGIFLVYYGHFVDKLYCKQSQGALVQVKLLGSFIMPLFFFLAGLFFKPQIESITNSLFDKIKKRLLPVAFFSLINLPIVLVTGPLDPLFVFKCYAYGVPVLNTPTWFLISLFLVESTVIILSPLIAPYKNIYFILVASIFFAIGLTLPQYSDHILAEAQLPKQFWYIVLTPLVLGFYFLGYALKKVVALNLRWQINFFIFFLSGFIFLRTFDLNVSLPEIYPVVWFVTSDYGNPFWFMVTALSGIISVIFLVKSFIRQSNCVFDFIGKHTLIYLGLSGICVHFSDNWFLEKLGYTPQTTGQILLLSSAYTIEVFFIFAPAAALLGKYFPLFTGARTNAKSKSVDSL